MMNNNTQHIMLHLFILLSLIGSLLMSGVFFGFSVGVMPGLARVTPAANGIAAMQQINIVIVNPLFISVFMFTSLTCIIAAILAWIHLPTTTTPAAAVLILLGSFCYCLGSFGVTIFCNVPMNNILAKQHDIDGIAYWHHVYLRDWTWWNSVRAGFAAMAGLCFFVAVTFVRETKRDDYENVE